MVVVFQFPCRPAPGRVLQHRLPCPTVDGASHCRGFTTPLPYSATYTATRPLALRPRAHKWDGLRHVCRQCLSVPRRRRASKTRCMACDAHAPKYPRENERGRGEFGHGGLVVAEDAAARSRTTTKNKMAARPIIPALSQVVITHPDGKRKIIIVRGGRDFLSRRRRSRPLEK